MSTKPNIGKKDDYRSVMVGKLDFDRQVAFDLKRSVVERVLIRSDKVLIKIQQNASFKNMQEYMDKPFKQSTKNPVDSPVKKFSNLVRNIGNKELYNEAHLEDNLNSCIIYLDRDIMNSY